MIQNTIKALLPALAISVFAVSCNDSNDYTPASVPDNHQVYFDYTEGHTFSIEENQENVSVKVYRIDTNGDLSVPFTATAPEGQADVFDAPATINFADGQNVTDLYIGIKFANIVARDTYQLTLTIDSSETTAYGDASCSLTMQYFEKGDPMRDAISGNYGGYAEGGQYWSNAFYYTGWSQTYGSDGVSPLRMVQAEERDEISIENLLPENDVVTISALTGKVTTLGTAAEAIEWWGGADYYPSSYWGSDNDGSYDLLGYITFPAGNCGTLALDWYGVYIYDLYFAAAWSTGSWATNPTNDMVVYIVGKRYTADDITGKQPGSDTYEIKQLDFYTNGWCMLFGYAEYGAWYYAAYGGSVLDKVQ